MTTSAGETVGEMGARAGVRRVADIVFANLSAVFVVALLVQVFLAGAGTFGIYGSAGDWDSGFDAHRTLGNVLGVIAVVLLVLALVARPSLWTVLGALAVAVLTEAAQHALADGGTSDKWVGGLHALDGMLILLLAVWLTAAARRRDTLSWWRAG